MDPSNRSHSTDQGRSNGVWPKQEEIRGTHRSIHGSLGNPSATGGQQMALDPVYGGHQDYVVNSAQPQPLRLDDTTAAFRLQDQLTSAAAGKIEGEITKAPQNTIGNAYLQNQSMVAANQPTQVRTPLSEPYLQSKPDYIYNMPGGTLLNFTLVEVIALLVNWFKVYPDLAERFLNNGLTSGTHMIILEEHRNIFMLEKDRNRTKDLISDGYRRSMRKINEAWTKAKHKKPQGWDGNALSVNHLTHEKGGKARPIPMKVLMNDIKHLPQGHDAGDLTRALQYAISNQKRGPNAEFLDWLFPDDLHTILGHIGYTTITLNHLDEAAVARFDTICKQKEQLNRKRRREAQGKGMSPPHSKRQLRGECAGDNDPNQSMPQPAVPGPVFQSSAQGALPTLLSTVPAPSDIVFRSRSRLIAPQHGAQIPQPLSRPTGYASIDPSLQDDNAVEENGARPNAAFAQQAEKATIPTLTMPVASDLAAKQHTSMQEIDTRPAAAFAHQADKAATPALSMPAGLRLATNEPNPDLSNWPNQSTPMAPPPNIISVQPSAAGDTFMFAQEDFDISVEEIDAIIAGNQTHNFDNLLEGPFSDFLPESLAEITQEYPTAYPLDKVLSECAEADDLEDDSVVARAARWCRDPTNFAQRYTVRDLGFIVTLQDLVEDAVNNVFDGSVEQVILWEGTGEPT